MLKIARSDVWVSNAVNRKTVQFIIDKRAFTKYVVKQEVGVSQRYYYISNYVVNLTMKGEC